MTKDGLPALPTVDWSDFAGVRQPGCTQVPDEVLDWIMAYLTGAELKVLLYIVRRTFGFKKEADAISLDQLCHGIVRHDGRRLDLGTGLKRPTVLEALRSLRAKNLIVAAQQLDSATGSRPTIYALRLTQPEADMSSDAVPGGMPKHTPEYAASAAARMGGVWSGIPPGYAETDPQETGLTRNRRQGDRRAHGQTGTAGWIKNGTDPFQGTATRPLDDQATDPMWRATLEELRLIMTAENYQMWLAPTRVAAHEDNLLRIAVPTPYQRDWLDAKLRHRIEATLRRLGHHGTQVEFIVAESKLADERNTMRCEA